MTEEELLEIVAKATPGPWEVSDRVARVASNKDRFLVIVSPGVRWVSLVMENSPQCEEDARLIALAPTVIPALAEKAAKLEGEVARLREALTFYRDQWHMFAVGDEGDGVTDFGRIDGYEMEPTAALKEDGGQFARTALSKGERA